MKYSISNVTACVDGEQLGQVRGCLSLSGVKWETGLLGMGLVNGLFGLQIDWTVTQAVIPPELFGSFTLVLCCILMNKELSVRMSICTE